MNRVLFEITGADRVDFLQGLVTNDMAKLGDGSKNSLLYAALLSPQGKYLADFFLATRADAPETILLDAPEALAPALIQRLSMYKLRADVQIAPSSLIASRGTGPAPEGALPDPRHSALGWRLYNARDQSDGTDWEALRVAHCIPAAGIELIPNESYILEAGFERLHGVDFKKGCYVGQEVTARMKHKTELRKGFARVAIEGSAPVGTSILADGKDAGTLFTQSGGRAIAYLRFERAQGEMQAGAAKLRLDPI
ncbi:MAG: folate-binding protein YgfZ [Halocynthiibacter sp.]|jgi:folate-binding protein YgfZ